MSSMPSLLANAFCMSTTTTADWLRSTSTGSGLASSLGIGLSAAARGLHHSFRFSTLQRPHGEEVGVGYEEREGYRQQGRGQPNFQLISGRPWIQLAGHHLHQPA